MSTKMSKIDKIKEKRNNMMILKKKKKDEKIENLLNMRNEYKKYVIKKSLLKRNNKIK
jgi:hypothetical protein